MILSVSRVATVLAYTLHDHKTNDFIRRELKIAGILDRIDEYRLNWHLHLQRMPQNRIQLKLLIVVKKIITYCDAMAEFIAFTVSYFLMLTDAVVHTTFLPSNIVYSSEI